jgi:hypothetical protein
MELVCSSLILRMTEYCVELSDSWYLMTYSTFLLD